MTAPSTRRRGVCRGCRRTYQLTGAGLLRQHNAGWDRCWGAGLAPVPAPGTDQQ